MFTRNPCYQQPPSFSSVQHWCYLAIHAGVSATRQLEQLSVMEAGQGRLKGLVSDRPGESKLERLAASLIELTGVIKWFDLSKGYGFVVPDNGMPDVLLHVTCLQRDGFQVAYEGARVVLQVFQGPRGLQAFHVLAMDESMAVRSMQMPPPRSHMTVTPTSALERAQV